MGTKRWTEEELKQVATSIQNYIDQNKHKQDFLYATTLQPAIYKRGTNETYDLSIPTELAKFNNMITLLKNHDVIRWKRDVPNGKFGYTVSPKYLDKTGVVTHIPTPPKVIKPEPLPRIPAMHDEEIRKQTVAFIEEEMKKVNLASVVVRYQGAVLEMEDVNLY